MMEILIILSALIFSGFGTIVGFGGGVFMIPLLVIGFHVPLNIAVGSVLVALFPSALVSTIFNWKKKLIDYKTGLLLEIPTMFGTVFGSLLSVIIPLIILEWIFGIFVVYLGINFIIKSYELQVRNSKDSIFYKLNKIGPAVIRRTEYGAYRVSFMMALVFGVMAGTAAGLFGIGGGFLKVPIMVGIFSTPSQIASATGLFMILLTSLTGSISHYFLGNVHFGYAVPVMIGFVIGAFAGNSLSTKIDEHILKRLIGIGLSLSGLAFLVHSIFL
jgi:uncharacterized membrane protein YfcA